MEPWTDPDCDGLIAVAWPTLSWPPRRLSVPEQRLADNVLSPPCSEMGEPAIGACLKPEVGSLSLPATQAQQLSPLRAPDRKGPEGILLQSFPLTVCTLHHADATGRQVGVISFKNV